jgi:alpha-ketoglutarate-dependent taurine dioxygenase
MMSEDITKEKVGARVDVECASLDLLYEHTVLILPDMWKYCGGSAAELYEFHRRFGIPWKRADYRFSMEYEALMPRVDITSYVDGAFSKLGDNDHEIPWHSDVPIHGDKGLNWPIRSLTAWRLPQHPTASSFCSTYAIYDALSEEEKAFASEVSLTYQSWYQPGTQFTDMPLVQSHPVTGRKFLALNSYNQGKNMEPTKRWIAGVKLSGDTLSGLDCRSVLGRYDEAIEELAYSHVWEYGEMVIFDNAGLLHRRDGRVDPANPRKFFRMNLRHFHQVIAGPAAC